MAGLLEKDLRLIAKRKNYFIMMILIGFLLGVMGGNNFVVGYLTMICAIFSMSTVSIDEQDNGFEFMFTLPVTAKDYVIEKFILAFFLGVMGWAFGLVLLFLGCVYNQRVMGEMSNFLAYIPLFLILDAIGIPCNIKFGADKSRIVMILIMGLGVCGYALIEKAAAASGADISNFVKVFDSLPDFSIWAIIVLITVVIIAVSIKVSTVFLNQKEY